MDISKKKIGVIKKVSENFNSLFHIADIEGKSLNTIIPPRIHEFHNHKVEEFMYCVE